MPKETLQMLQQTFISVKFKNSDTLKVHKRENFFGSDFELFTILQLVKLKY